MQRITLTHFLTHTQNNYLSYIFLYTYKHCNIYIRHNNYQHFTTTITSSTIITTNINTYTSDTQVIP